MLATRVIPILLHRKDELVKGATFDSWRSVGHVRQAVRIHQARGVDELVVLDIGATPAGHGPDLQRISDLTEECFMPITVGGGIRTLEQIQQALQAGADKVAIGTAAHFDKSLIPTAAKRLGNQAIVAAIDVRDGWVWVNCGTIPTRWRPAQLARKFEIDGAGEILLTSIDRDGTLKGYDLELIEEVTKRVNIPVVAAGGAGTYEHLLQAIRAGAHAVAAGAMFQFTDCTPRGAAQYLKDHGIEVRL